MPRFIHSISVPEQAIGADGVYTFDLAVNPLSVVLLALRPLNDTGTLANFQSYLGICAACNKVSILHNGENIVSGRGEDLAVLNYFRHGIVPPQATHLNVNNDRRCVVLPILLGRHAYDRSSCFPASKRGQLVLELDLDIADTGYDGLRLSVETIELPDANPKEFERKVAINQTNAATGDVDIDLPVGNLHRGLLLWGTTGFTGAAPAPSWGRVKTLLDNQEVNFTASDWEVTHMLSSLWGRQPFQMDTHRHIITTDGNAQAELATLAGVYNVGVDVQSYSFLDFDPTKDDEFSIDTRGKNRFHIRPNVETADAVRCIPIEVVKV